MSHVGGVFRGRLTRMTLKFAARVFSFCTGTRKHAIVECADGAGTTSRAVSVTRQAYVSPYDRAVLLLQQLLCLPCVAQIVYPILIDENARHTGDIMDPTRPLRTLFGRGCTLNMLVNELESPFVATIDLCARRDGATFEQHQIELFWRGCVGAGLVAEDTLARLSPAARCDVENDDCLELMATTVAAIVDVLHQRDGWVQMDPRFLKLRDLYPTAHASAGGPRHAVLAAELARTEAAYVHDLERLVAYADCVTALLGPDCCDVDLELIFGLIRRILALHRVYSMRIEYLAAMPVERQRFDAAYHGLAAEFGVYSEFCATRETSQRAFDRALPVLRLLETTLDPAVDVPALFMRPVQRLAQYPILFQSLADALADSTLPAPQRDPAMASARAALQQSRDILAHANETTREALNQAQLVQFFARLDDPLGRLPAPEAFGRLLTSGRVAAQVGRTFEDLEGYLFENTLVVCQADRASRTSRTRRTISMLQLTIKSPARSRHDDRRGSGSSNSSSTLGTPSVLRSRSPAPESYSPEDRLAMPAAGFQLPAIDAGTAIAMDTPPPPPPPLPLLSPTFGSHGSLNTLRDRAVIRFAPGASTDHPADSDSARGSGSLPRLLLRELIPTSAVSQVTQLSEVDGSFRLTIMATMADGTAAVLVFKQLSKEAAGLWLRMLKRAVPLVAIEESVSRGNDNYSLLVNPRFNAIRATHLPQLA
ncbi:Guanine nucleotide exchange factor for Cdc42p [Coemansia spiralis]|nr:Guanine nucleotide exchange factor for Cdc42p [Coemansia spiralis]